MTMIDRAALHRLFYRRHPPVPSGAAHTVVGRIASLRRAVWWALVDAADEHGKVALWASQIAAAIAGPSGRSPGSRNIQHALKWLRDAGLLKVIDPGHGNRCNTYQLRIPRPRGQPVPGRRRLIPDCGRSTNVPRPGRCKGVASGEPCGGPSSPRPTTVESSRGMWRAWPIAPVTGSAPTSQTKPWPRCCDGAWLVNSPSRSERGAQPRTVSGRHLRPGLRATNLGMHRAMPHPPRKALGRMVSV